MKTLTMPVIPCHDTESIALSPTQSFHDTTRNPALKVISKLLVLFGLAMMFAVSGWGANADLSITKSVDDSTPTVGDNVTFTIVGRNNGPTTTDITITDTLPAGLTWVSDSENKSSFDCTNVGNAVTCTGTQDFTTDETVTITIVARVDSEGAITNTASIAPITAGVTDTVTTGNNSASVNLTATAPNADLSITKSVDDSTPTVGDNVTFTIVGRNNGPTTTDITITDTLPAGLTRVSDSDNGKNNFDCTNVGNAVTCTGTENFSTNETVTITIVARVDSAGTITNTASIAPITAGVTDTVTTGNNLASVNLTATAPNADLAITKSVDNATPSVGDTVSFTIIGTNNGPTTTQMTITDILPAGLTYIGYGDDKSNYSCSNSSGTVTCSGSRTFATGNNVTVTITATVASAGSITNTASIAPSTAGVTDTVTTGNNSASVNLTASNRADLVLTNSDSVDPVILNQNFSYTLNVSNVGPLSATSLTLTDTLPVGAVYQSVTGAGWSCSQASGVVTCTNPMLANGASAPVTINVTAPSTAGIITNTATVTSELIDPVLTNNTDINQSTTVVIPSDLNITKTSVSAVSGGEDYIYTIKVGNQGMNSASNVTVTDTLPSSVTYKSYSGSGWSCSGTTTLTCTYGTLANGTMASDLNFTVTAPLSAQIIEANSATVSTTTTESNTSNNTAVSGTVMVSNYCQSHGLSTGFHIIDPDGGSDSNSFEIFCSADTPKKDLITFGIKNNSNNFIFNSDALGSTNYYIEATSNATQFNAIEINPSTLQVITSGSLDPTTSGDGTYKILGKGFSNINLIGTPFAIDWDNTTISGCNTAKLTRKGYHGQTVKINSLDYDSKGRCQIDSMKLKLLSDYTYLTYNGGEVLEKTCKLMTEAVPTDVLDAVTVKGHYWINPNNNERSHNSTSITATDRPMVAYCWYQTDLKYTWTFVLALDGKVTNTKSDLINRADTCSEKGLWPFVPNNEDTFERVRGFLSDNKSSWENYTGTINEKVKTFMGGDYYLTSEQPSPLWPYGSFGVYFPYNGNKDAYNNDHSWGSSPSSTTGWMSGSPMHNIQNLVGGESDYARKNNDSGDSARDYYSWGNYSNTDASSGGNYTYADTMGYKGWKSVLSDLGKTDEWFISRTGAGDNFKNAGSNSTSYYEPNGNYTAGAWLNFLFDDQGRVRHNDDWDANYPYYDYMCMAEDNYDFTSQYSLVKGPFTVVEHDAVLSGLEYTNATLSTKIVNDTMRFDVVLLKNDFSDIRSDYNVSAGIFLDDTVTVGEAEVSHDLHYFGEIADFNTNRFELPAIKWPGGVETWTKAKNKLFFKFKYCSIDTMKWTDCWTLSGDTATCSDPDHCLDDADSDYFAVRPKSFGSEILTPLPLKAGASFSVNFKALDNLDGNTTDYNEAEGGSFDAIVNEAKTGCSIGIFKNSLDDTWAFTNGGKAFVDNNYSEVGIIDINITEGQKPCASRFAAVDCNDTALNVLTISDHVTQLVFTPDHFDLTANVSNVNNGSFTYLSNPHTVGNNFTMSGRLDLNITAKNVMGGTVQNYNTQCYANAKDINITYTPIAVPNLSKIYSQYLHDAIVMGDINRTLGTNIDLTGVTKDIFTVDHNGSAVLHFNINFDRNETKLVDKFDFNITRIDVKTTDEVNATIIGNRNVTYLYGRIIPRDIRVFGANPVVATAWYEVYNASDINGTVLPPSRNSTNWFINTLHTDVTDGDGVATQFQTGGAVSVASGVAGTPSVNGVESYNFGARAIGSYKAHIDTDPWLWYGVNVTGYVDPVAGDAEAACLTHPCFNINVVPAVGASGSAKTDATGNKSNKKSDNSAGNGGFKSTNDYSPAVR